MGEPSCRGVGGTLLADLREMLEHERWDDITILLDDDDDDFALSSTTPRRCERRSTETGYALVEDLSTGIRSSCDRGTLKAHDPRREERTMSNPENLINSISAQEPIILPAEELIEQDDDTLPPDDVQPETQGDSPSDAELGEDGQGDIGGDTDPDMGVANSPDDLRGGTQ